MVSGKGCETIFPVLRFQDAGFPADLLECTKGFQTPTPIQSQVRGWVGMYGVYVYARHVCDLRKLVIDRPAAPP